jgi:hypothetical protein
MTAPQVAAQIGSGTLPYTYGILPPDERGSETDGGGVRLGLQVMVANPEDSVAVDAFVASGVTVGTTAVEVLGPGINPLPRCRLVEFQNDGNNPILISHTSSFVDDDAFEVPP